MTKTDKIINTRKMVKPVLDAEHCASCGVTFGDKQPVELREVHDVISCSNCLLRVYWKIVNDYFEKVAMEQEAFVKTFSQTAQDEIEIIGNQGQKILELQLKVSERDRIIDDLKSYIAELTKELDK